MGTEAPTVKAPAPEASAVSQAEIAAKIQTSAFSEEELGAAKEKLEEMQTILSNVKDAERRKKAINDLLNPRERACILELQARRKTAEKAKAEQAARDAKAQQSWAGWAATAVGLMTPAPASVSSSSATDASPNDLTSSMVSAMDEPSAVTSSAPTFLGVSQVVNFADPTLANRLEEVQTNLNDTPTNNTPTPPIDSPPPPPEASLTATMGDSVLVHREDHDFDSDGESLGEDDGPPQLITFSQAEENAVTAEALRAQEEQQHADEIEAAAVLQQAEAARAAEEARIKAEEAAKQALLQEQEALRRQEEEAHPAKALVARIGKAFGAERDRFMAPQQKPQLQQQPTPTFLPQKDAADQKAAALKQEQEQAALKVAERRRFEADFRHKNNVQGL